MNIKTPFVLLNLDKKEIINRLKEKNLKDSFSIISYNFQ
jgi:hypothetical protein